MMFTMTRLSNFGDLIFDKNSKKCVSCCLIIPVIVISLFIWSRRVSYEKFLQYTIVAAESYIIHPVTFAF